MKILVHDYAGHPFQVQLSRELSRRGHVVMHAYATCLETPRGELEERGDDPGGFRLCPVDMDREYRRHKYSFWRRRGMEVRYGRRVASLIANERSDVVLSANTPTEAQETILRATLACGGRFFYWVQDFYSVAVDRLLRKKLPVVGGWIGRYYRRLEGRQLRASHRIIAITEDFVPLLVREFGIDARTAVVVPNWAPIESLPVGPKSNPWSRKHRLEEKFVFLYSGTLGMKHNPALLLDLAQWYRDDPKVQIVVVSEGLGAEWLRGEVAQMGLRNVLLVGYQAFEELPNVLASGDVLIGLLEDDAGVFSVPSKILTYLCMARPVLLAAPAVNLATRIVAAERAGLTVAPNDRVAFLAAAEHLVRQPALAAGMARRGRAAAERLFRIGEIGARFEALLGQSSGEPATEKSRPELRWPSPVAPAAGHPGYNLTPS